MDNDGLIIDSLTNFVPVVSLCEAKRRGQNSKAIIHG